MDKLSSSSSHYPASLLRAPVAINPELQSNCKSVSVFCISGIFLLGSVSSRVSPFQVQWLVKRGFHLRPLPSSATGLNAGRGWANYATKYYTLSSPHYNPFPFFCSSSGFVVHRKRFPCNHKSFGIVSASEEMQRQSLGGYLWNPFLSLSPSLSSICNWRRNQLHSNWNPSFCAGSCSFIASDKRHNLCYPVEREKWPFIWERMPIDLLLCAKVRRRRIKGGNCLKLEINRTQSPSRFIAKRDHCWTFFHSFC